MISHNNNCCDSSNNNKITKTVVIGDSDSGKTSLIARYITGRFISFDIPRVFETYSTNSAISYPWDTAGGKEYDRLRPLSYLQTDCFIICFSISDRSSFNRSLNFWYPEIQLLYPKVPIILASTKSDLYQSSKYLNYNLITYQEGIEMANKIQAVEYIETSALNDIGVKKLFETAKLIGSRSNATTISNPIQYFQYSTPTSKYIIQSPPTDNDNYSDIDSNDSKDNNNSISKKNCKLN